MSELFNPEMFGLTFQSITKYIALGFYIFLFLLILGFACFFIVKYIVYKYRVYEISPQGKGQVVKEYRGRFIRKRDGKVKFGLMKGLFSFEVLHTLPNLKYMVSCNKFLTSGAFYLYRFGKESYVWLNPHIVDGKYELEPIEWKKNLATQIIKEQISKIEERSWWKEWGPWLVSMTALAIIFVLGIIMYDKMQVVAGAFKEAANNLATASACKVIPPS